MHTNTPSCRVYMHPAAGNSPKAVAAMTAATGRIAVRRKGGTIIHLISPADANRYLRDGGNA
ncbi:hypothetical protein R84981_000954 [Carnimonas sp. R-84981]